MKKNVVQEFNPREESHVTWLKSVNDAMTKATSGERVDVARVWNDNPMGIPLESVAELAYQHFQVAMKYANAVLSSDAFVPAPAFFSAQSNNE